MFSVYCSKSYSSDRRIDSLLDYSIPYYPGKYSALDSRRNLHSSDRRIVLDMFRWKCAVLHIVAHPKRYPFGNHTCMPSRLRSSYNRCYSSDTLDSPSYYIGNQTDREQHTFSGKEKKLRESERERVWWLLSADMSMLWHYPNNWADRIRKDSRSNRWDL